MGQHIEYLEFYEHEKSYILLTWLPGSRNSGRSSDLPPSPPTHPARHDGLRHLFVGVCLKESPSQHFLELRRLMRKLLKSLSFTFIITFLPFMRTFYLFVCLLLHIYGCNEGVNMLPSHRGGHMNTTT